MLPPAITPIAPDALDARTLREALPEGAGPVRLFAVTRAGTFDGRAFESGEVIVVGGAAEVDDRAVLVPRGIGRPILGHRREDGLTGTVGEPCATARWRPIGRVVQVLRQPAWRLEAPVAPAPPVRPRRARRPAGQLDLFVAA